MKYFFICIILVMSFWNCKEKYISPALSSATGLLVVEDFINSCQASTNLTLTRTIRLVHSVQAIYENNVQMNIKVANHVDFFLKTNYDLS